MRAVVLLGLLAGCVALGDEEPYPSTGGGEPGSFEAVEAVFRSRCNSCHTGTSPMGGLDLSDVDQLIGADGSERPSSSSHCGGLPLVRPFEPDASCLWLQVKDGLMPPGGMPAADQEAIRSWIEAGAELPSLQDR